MANLKFLVVDDKKSSREDLILCFEAPDLEVKGIATPEEGPELMKNRF